MSKVYSPKKERTAKLYKAWQEMSKEAALKYGVEELGYSKSGCSSWLSWWSNGNAPKVETVEAAPAPTKVKKPAAKKKVEKKVETIEEATAIADAILTSPSPKKPKKARTAKAAKVLEPAA